MTVGVVGDLYAAVTQLITHISYIVTSKKPYCGIFMSEVMYPNFTQIRIFYIQAKRSFLKVLYFNIVPLLLVNIQSLKGLPLL